MQSCLYQGSVFHARREPVSHRFRYSVAMAYLDLDEATQLLRESWLASASRWSPLAFRADDHLLGDDAASHDDDESDRTGSTCRRSPSPRRAGNRPQRALVPSAC